MYGSQFHKPIVVVGSINADLVCQTERIPLSGETLLGSNFRIFPGGKGANQAVAVARLGCPVHMIGKLGDDAFAGLLRLSLTDAGVNVAGVDTVSEASGVAFIEVAASGANSIVVVPGANVRLLPADLDRHVELLRAAGAVLAQLEIPIGTVDYLAQICRREQIPLILDPAPACALPAQLLRSVAWFTPNETEAAFYTHAQEPAQQREALLAQGVEGVVLKRGKSGVSLATSAGLRADQPAFKVRAVDSTAAGDAFNGAFAAALMLGAEPAAAARFASAAAAVSVTRAGAQPSMATRAEVDALLSQQA
jgi:ribokinase